jgi:hypothetical protein
VHFDTAVVIRSEALPSGSTKGKRLELGGLRPVLDVHDDRLAK